MNQLIKAEKYSLKDFYKEFGLIDYPFNVYTAENETQFADDIFVHPEGYDAIKSSFDSKRSIIIRGNRGTGKTALINDLYKNAPSSSLLCTIDDYSELSLSPQMSEYYSLIIASLVTSLFHRLFDSTNRIDRLNRDDKEFLSFLLSEYTTPTTKSELIRKIEEIQLSRIKRFIKKHFNIIRAIINYGLNVGVNILNDVIRSHYGLLPPVEESHVRDLIPKISLETETDFNQAKISYNLLTRVCALIDKLGYSRIILFFDKFDEDSRLENNAEAVSEFIKPLLTENKLLENPNIQIIISVWEVPFSRILSEVRSQKHHCPLLSWSKKKLEDALNRRLFVFSQSAISNYQEIFDSEISEDIIDEIFTLSNGNPRDLWHIFNSIIQSQYSIDSHSNRLSLQAIEDGLKSFVVSFNFYEYYPRRPNAKANAMDVYSYIKHLLKLPKEVFTKNQLNEYAKTGSSTSNYVIGMEQIGLVVNTYEKDKGGVVYKINDPKVIFAMKNDLDISKR